MCSQLEYKVDCRARDDTVEYGWDFVIVCFDCRARDDPVEYG